MDTATERLSTHLGEIALLTAGPADSPVPPLVLLHGFLATKEFWCPLLSNLPASLRILALDLWPLARPHGQGTGLDFDFLADALEAVRLQLALPRLQLAAQDLGNLVLLRYLYRYPHAVARSVFLSPALYPDQKLPKGLIWWRRPIAGALMTGSCFEQALQHFYRQGTGQISDVQAAITGSRVAFGPPAGKATLKQWVHWGHPRLLFWDHPPMLRGIDTPNLILYGEANPYIHYSQVERLGRHLDRKQTRIVYLAQCGHFPSLEVPARTGHEMGRFLMAR